QPEAGPEAEQPGTPQPVAELVTDVVAQRGADRRGGDHGVKIEHTLMREESGREHQTFARDQETRECGGLEGRRIRGSPGPGRKSGARVRILRASGCARS